MSTENVINIIANIIAVYAALLSTYLVLKERFKLKFTLLNNYLTYSHLGSKLSENGFFYSIYSKDSYDLFMKVRIINNSKNPTTLNEFILNKNIKYNAENIPNPFIPIKFKLQGEELTYTDQINGPKFIQLPIYLEPYSSVEGFLYFRNFDIKPSNFNIKINASQGNKKFNLKFKVNDCAKM